MLVGCFIEVCMKRGLNADDVKYCKKVASGKIVAGTIRSLVNARALQLECARVLHGE